MFKRIKESKEEIVSMKYFYYIVWQIILFVFIYLTLLSFFENDALPPKGHLFHMFFLFILSHICGKITYVIKLPTLFGMLIAGFIYGNLLKPDLDKFVVSTIRSIALMVILLRAGLHLVPEYIRTLSFACIRVTVIPFMIETFTVGLCSYWFFEFDFVWSLMIGFVLAAVSPAVVVPCMIRIQNSNLSPGKGIPTLNIAAASIDDVLAVTGFNICRSFAFDQEKHSLAWNLAKGPVEIVLGVGFGIFIGILLWYIPERYDASEDTKKYHLSRFSLLFMAGMFAMFGSLYFDMEASGPLAILIMAFVAVLRWRQNGWEEDNEQSLKIVWLVLKRFLFCLIGAELLIEELDINLVVQVIVVILIGILFKIVAAYLVTYGIGLNRKERLFVAISWIPKATVQAAIGPVALTLATNDQEKRNGAVILTSAAISILMTAPLGAIIIDYLCDRLLTKPGSDINNNNNNVNININCQNGQILNGQTKFNGPLGSVKSINIDLDL